ncbi:McrBC 5-methylcytosine restriction system component [uncultured archaeon]|nr:McrBC 5-methylcytosine restriction system component [uncultured archaeon]
MLLNTPRTITLFEHQECTYKDLEDRKCGFQKDHQIILKRLYGDKKPKIFHFLDGALKATNLIGIVRIGDFSIEILPKIDITGKADAKDAESVYSARTNLLFLLRYAFDLKPYENDIAAMHKKPADWFEILTFLYAKNLQEALKRGIFRNYITHEENLGVLKGKWLISQHLNINPFQKHRFYVQYDEFSPDNLLNQVLKFATIQIRCQSMDASNRQQLAILSDWMDEVILPPALNNAVLEQIIFTRLNERFRPLFNMAKLFLENQAIETQAGATNAFAYTFDMNKLFEKFIAKFIQEHRGRILGGTGYELCDILEKARGSHKYLAKDDKGKDIFRLEPDIIFKNKDGTVPLIIDTKYKILNDKERKKGIKEEDMYQAAVYAQIYKCQRVVLIYPQVNNITPIQKNFKLNVLDAEVEVRTVNLSIDLPKEVLKIINELNRIIVGRKSHNNGINV